MDLTCDDISPGAPNRTVLDADTGRSLPYVRAFVRALMSNLSALPCFLGFFWMLWEPRKRTLARHGRRQPGRADHLLPTRRVRRPAR